MPIPRNLQPFILSDLEQYDQMLFVSGPRQCGKTTLAEMILDRVGMGRYWNYDISEDQILLAKKPSFFEEVDRKKGVKPLIVFDEIHKYPRWKNVLKGAYDRSRKEFRFLITGSGRLDLYQKVKGDALKQFNCLEKAIVTGACLLTCLRAFPTSQRRAEHRCGSGLY